MTLDELYRDKPAGEVIITGGELNNTYKAVVCHGCQTCGFGESYPHYLSIEEITECPPTSSQKSGEKAEPATSTQIPEVSPTRSKS